MKKTSILALVTASALVLGGCGIFNPTKLTPPELPSGQAVETPSDEGKGGVAPRRAMKGTGNRMHHVATG